MSQTHTSLPNGPLPSISRLRYGHSHPLFLAPTSAAPTSALTYAKFMTTADQSLSVAVRIRPIYLKEVTWVRGIPSDVNAISDPALSSSSSRQLFLLNAHRWQKSVVVCCPLRDSCDTNMLHWGHLG